MKITIYLLNRPLLVVCLTLYGTLGMATAGIQDAVFSIEGCASGVAKTVLTGTDGGPVEPAQNCRKPDIRLMSRGSPVTHFSMPATSDLIETDQSLDALKLRCDGRQLFKGATA